MAKGLRKLIKNAWNKKTIQNNRLMKLSPRLKVEELEERIAPAALAAGEYTPYDNGASVGVLYNAGTTSVDITWTNVGGGLDTLVIDCDAVGAVHLQATDALSGTAGVLVTDSANVSTFTLETGVDVANTGTLSAAIGVAHLQGADPGNAAAVTATGGDATGSITLDNGGTSTISLLNINDGGTGTGAFNGAIAIDGDLTTVTVDGNAAGDWTGIGGTVNGVWTIGGTLSANVTAAGGVTSAGDITADTISGALIATTVGWAGDITTTGTTGTGNFASLTTSAGAISGNLDIAGTITGNITGDDGISGDIDADTITGAIIVTDGNLEGSITTTGVTGTGNIGDVTVDTGGTGDFSGTIDSAGTLGTVTVGDDMSGTITTDGTITAIVSDAGDVSTVITTSAGDLTTFTLTSGAFSGTLDIFGALTTMTASGNIGGAITAGNIATLTSTNGNLSATVISDTGGIATVNADADGSANGDFSGSISSATTIGTITVGDQITGDITAAGAITGIVSLNGDITNTSAIQAGGTITAVTVDAGGSNGDMAGTITTTDGNVTAITLGGALSGTVLADDDIGAVTAPDGISGSLTTTTGSFTGAIAIATAGGFTGSINSGLDITGNMTISAGNFTGTVVASNDITGNITVAAGGTFTGTITATNGLISGTYSSADSDITGAITAGTDFNGTITATAGAVTGTVKATTGNFGGTVTAGVGDVASVIVGGNLTGSVIAEDDVTSVDVGGNITGATITADSDSDNTGNVVSVVADGSISGTITGEDILLVRSGGTAGADHITATITAAGDIDLIDAGSANMTGVVTATAAESGSPLATFIHGGASYAVWAFESGSTTTVDTGVTATVVFDGNAGAGGIPRITITNLADSTAGTTPDIYVTSRQDTSAAQAFNDPDVNVNNKPFEVNTFSAAAAVTVNDVVIEGNFASLGTTPNITIAGDVQVEGGVAGTVTVTSGQDLTYGSVAAGGLTVNGNVGTFTTHGDINGNLTINGSVDEIVVGSSALGQEGDVDTGVTIAATGAIGTMNVNGVMNGSITATGITSISVSEDIGDATLANNVVITATTGNIGTIFAAGNIGNDAGSTVTIRSLLGDIGTVSAVGEIGGGAAVTTITANGSITEVSTTNGGIGNGVQTVITASTGSITTITAGGANGIDAAVNARLDIVTVSTTAVGAAIAGTTTITTSNGDITTVSTVEGALGGAITATIGDIDSVSVLEDPIDGDNVITAGVNSANITAGGDVDTVAGLTVTGTTIATLGTTGSPVTTWTAGAVTYTLDATPGAIYNYTFNGAGAQPANINITVDNWDNVGAVAYAAAIDVQLITTATDLDGSTILNGTQFDLRGLDFDADSVANGANEFGTVRVEGDVFVNNGAIAGFGIDAGANGSLVNLIVEGDVALPVLVDSVSFVSVGSALGIDAPTAAQMEAMFSNPLGGAVTFAIPADGTQTVPVSGSSAGDDISVSLGDGTGLIDPVSLDTGVAGVGAYDLTIAGGLITDIDGGMTASGNVVIDGDLTYTLRGTNIGDLTVTGNITSTGGVIANNLNEVLVGTAGDITKGDMAGTITVTANPGLALAGNINDIRVLGDFSGTITAEGTIGDVLVGQMINIVSGADIYDGSFTGVLAAAGNYWKRWCFGWSACCWFGCD